jgi:ribonuclease BN (tRNA processing enzyme)
MPVEVTFVGSGDAFGSGGRLHTCFALKAPGGGVLVDCGASALIGLRRLGLEPNDFDLILVSHLHGDHFGGIPFFVLEAQFVSKRSGALTVAGPPGTAERLEQAMEVLFPGSAGMDRPFALEVVELDIEQKRDLGPVAVTPYEVRHASGAPALALRMQCADRVITYSGDTEWTEALIPAARDADLFIAEAYTYDRPIKWHLDYRTLMDRLPELGPKRLVITHLGADLLQRAGELDCEVAEDGKVIAL